MIDRRRFAFLLFPLSQVATGAVLVVWIVRLGMAAEFLYLVIALLIGSAIADVLLFREMKSAQDADIARDKVRMLEEQERVQVQYRQQLARDKQDILKLRAQVAGELERAGQRLAEHRAREAHEDMMRAVDLMGTSSLRMCPHRAVDAAATMKARACREAGVEPRFALDIPDDVPIPSTELCALVTNLADNGLAAARRAKGEAGAGAAEGAAEGVVGTAAAEGAAEAAAAKSAASDSACFLEMRGFVRGEYLVIEACNNISAAEEDRLREAQRRRKRTRPASLDEVHGWGLSIVERIAERHEGALTIGVVDRVFRATVVLHLPGQTSVASGAGDDPAASNVQEARA